MTGANRTAELRLGGRRSRAYCVERTTVLAETGKGTRSVLVHAQARGGDTSDWTCQL